MKRWGRLAICALCLAGMAACGHVQDYLEIAKAKGVSQTYLEALQHWTRSKVVYSQFETKVRIEATLRSPEFNRAYFREYFSIYPFNADERKRQDDLRGELESESTEFIFYAYIPNKGENDFDRSGSIWTIRLIRGGGEGIRPSEVRRIDPVTPVVTEFFPYGNPYYGNFYRLRFPQSDQNGPFGGPMKLVFSSVIGRVELEFEGR